MDDEDSVGKEGNDKTSWFKSLKRSNLHKKLNYAVPGAGLGTVGGMVGRFNKSELDMSSRTGALSPACGADCVTGDLAGLRVTELQSASQLSAAEHYYTIDSRNLASRHKLSAQDKNLQQAAKQFNLDPDKGLKILEDKGFIKLEPLSIAQFLLSHGRLSKKQIGKRIYIKYYFINLHSTPAQESIWVGEKTSIKTCSRHLYPFMSSPTCFWSKRCDSSSGVSVCQEKPSKLTGSLPQLLRNCHVCCFIVDRRCPR